MTMRTHHSALAIFLLAVLGWLAAATGISAGAEAPRRVVSFNLCADQLVVALADPGQIAGLSPYADDPTLSVVAKRAKAFPTADWQAESTLALQPDLVLVGPNDRTATQRMLRSFGLPVAEVDVVADLDAARRQIGQIAGLLGHPDRGEALISRLDAAVRRLAALPRPPLRTALMVERGGYAAGPRSLAATLLDAAGLRPPAGAPPGLGGYVSLEHLLVLHPDLLVLRDPPVRAEDQGAVYLTHPALRALYPPSRRIALPSRYTLCGGPALVSAFDYLTTVMKRLATRNR